MARNCKCSGGCCGPQDDGVNRRDFLTLVGAGTAAAMAGGSAWADWLQQQASPEELARWKKALMQAAPARLYRSGVHTDARMHLGGIGTGNVEIGCDGQFTTWQLFNTLRDGYVPLMFAVKVGSVAKLLQTAGSPNWPRVKQIEMSGEYPIATLRYLDPELPVKVELSAFSPFAPLDSRFSSQPLAVLLFRIQNPTAENQTVSLAGMMQNAVGYDAIGPVDGVKYGKYGGNVNEPLRDGPAIGLLMRAEPGREPSLDRATALYVGANMQGLPLLGTENPKNLAVTMIANNALEGVAIPKPAESVIWFEEPPADFAAGSLKAAKRAVEAGATLVFSGKSMPLMNEYAIYCGKSSSERRAAIVFEDFEHGYGKWKVEGKAFGEEPAKGTLPSQQSVLGFEGKALVNSFAGGDASTGRLISQPFTIERHYIHFLVGGGSQPNVQMRLIVDEKTVRTVSGHDNEQLSAGVWDVREFAGKKAHLEIVDENTGPWGHINVDQIVFSDAVSHPELPPLLAELLPAKFTAIRTASGKQPTDRNSLNFDNLQLQPNAQERTLRSGFRVLVRSVGKGQVALATGAILDPGRQEAADLRHAAYGAMCELAGASYTPPQGVPPSACGFGTMALVALADSVTVLPAFEDWNDAWKQLQEQGSFTPFDQAKPNAPTSPGRSVNGAIAATVNVPAGGTIEVPFLLAWHYPNKYTPSPAWLSPPGGVSIGCHYATLWPDAKAVIHDAAADFPAIRGRTESFRKTFYDSTLPYWLLDCITSQAATIRHIGIVFRIANGDVYGWEGSNGCCDPTCTHVWGYEQSLSRLFPDLERDMRRIDFKHQQCPDGGIYNRTAVPSPPHPSGEHTVAADGHASCILKAYREALNCPDDSFFKEYWPNVKKAVEYFINRDAATSGGTPDGTLEDDQWNTYDENLHGVTTFISGYYLAALRAGEEWAKRMGDTQTAERFHAIFLKGQENLVKRCWNGEYFRQDLPDYLKRGGEVGPGCMADQLIGQWWAHQLGLGYILPKDKVQTALRSIFKYNWLTGFAGFKQWPRTFVGDKDKGLLIVTWPKGGRPKSVMLYSDEVWTGIEYQVAAHMIYEGMLEEGYAIVKGARDRYDGIPRGPIGRNPWNEIECGGHYARAMSSWSLLLALSGYEYDGLTKILRFAPRVTPADFKAFFSGPEGWGSLRQHQEGATQRSEIQVVEGRLAVAQLRLVPPDGVQHVRATLGNAPVEATLKHEPEGVTVTLADSTVVKAGDTLVVSLS